MGDNGYIAIDLDGTLAEYHGFKGIDHIGEPVIAILEKVKVLVAAGTAVKIFTARVSGDNAVENEKARMAIWVWLEKHGLPRLEITNVKDFHMWQLWDDRCKQIIPNSGIFVEDLLLSMLSPLGHVDLAETAKLAGAFSRNTDDITSAIGKTIVNCVSTLELAKAKLTDKGGRNGQK